MTDYLKLVKDKESELNDLYTRMDADRDLVNLVKGELKDVNDKKIPNTIFVTLNMPAVFAANVEASLNAASEQVYVETDSKTIDTAYIEDMVRASFASANKRLISRGWFPLDPYFDQQMCRRGRGAARCLSQMKEGKDATGKAIMQLDTDITPWDTRFVAYAMGQDGLDWASYRTKRSRDQIESEYPPDQYPDAKINSKTAEVLDIWSREGNIVYIGGKKIIEQEHPFGYCPVALQLVTLGSMLADEDSLKYRGESVFFLIRDLVPELNRLVSIIQNINMKTLDRSKVWRSKEGQQEPPEYDDIDKPGRVLAAETGGGPDLVPIGEIQRSAYLLHTMIESAIQKGSLSDIDLGTLNFELSAVALIEIGEGRDQVFLPRLGARGLLNQQLAEMLIDQVIKTGENSIEIGTRGHKRAFDVAKLQGDYEIEFRYFVKSPKVDMARVSMAAAYGNLIPDKAKRREVLAREDPDEDERLLRWEEAERLSPAVKIHRTIKALLEEAERGNEDAAFEAELLSAEMGVNLKQLLAGEASQVPKPETAEAPQPLLPTFGKGGGKTSAKKSADLQAEPRMSEGENA